MNVSFFHSVHVSVCVCISVRLCEWLIFNSMTLNGSNVLLKTNKLFLQISLFLPMRVYPSCGVISLRLLLFELITSFWIFRFGSTEWISSNEFSVIIINTKMYLDCVCLSVTTNRPIEWKTIQPIWMRCRKPVLKLSTDCFYLNGTMKLSTLLFIQCHTRRRLLSTI